MQTLALFSLHFGAALAIFHLINWVGKHAVDFGYSSASLFDDGEESVALNLFIKALLPTVFIVVLSAGLVAAGFDECRLGTRNIVYFYFLIRLTAIFLLGRTALVSWPKFVVHAAIGICIAELAYEHLILPNNSLLPDLKTAGNELWLAIFAFFYAILNKVPLSDGPPARRKNRYIKDRYEAIKKQYGSVIDTSTQDPRLQLVTYAIIVAEDFARPAPIRVLERFIPPFRKRSTGIMQVQAEHALTDMESVNLGVERLVKTWDESGKVDQSDWDRVRDAILSHNRDEDYLWKVWEIAEIIAKRADRSFEQAFADI